jgi:hypothetical protein
MVRKQTGRHPHNPKPFEARSACFLQGSSYHHKTGDVPLVLSEYLIPVFKRGLRHFIKVGKLAAILFNKFFSILFLFEGPFGPPGHHTRFASADNPEGLFSGDEFFV